MEKTREYYLEKLGIIQSLCRSLIGKWEDAEGMLEIFSGPYVTKESIDGMIEVFENAYRSIKNDEIKNQMSKALEELRAIQEKERAERALESIEAERMLEKEMV